MPMAHCRVLLCNINKKSSCQDSGFLSISNKYLVTFHFPLAIYPKKATAILTITFYLLHKHPVIGIFYRKRFTSSVN